ncbi:MAG: UDP-N-acetylmuramoyl-tripeptide--D-alanyl-D-alanine ligase [Candidatus Bostrichicola ureolyticus]|nr:MAG: UDP-N-acetylmuramoyl-tripeptide--D-alanyl-D-alanine ligase [Candidatus Bostrichicola ureolyticus]
MNIKNLYKQYLISSGVSIDTRQSIKNKLFFAINGKVYDGNCFANEAILKGASAAVIDNKKYYLPNKKMYLVNNSLIALQELAVFHRKKFNIPFIAITGSNGKTTTKELLYTILSTQYKTFATKNNLNNHIGVPLTILSIPLDTQIVILEIASNYKGEIKFLCELVQPNYGYITNFGYAHLEGFNNLEGVINEKSELYLYIKRYGNIVFINADDPLQIQKSLGINTYQFSTKNKNYNLYIKPIYKYNTISFLFKKQLIYPNLWGRYNITNISAAITIAYYFNISINNIINSLEKFKTINNRSQIIIKKQLYIILDAYNANPSSMKESINNINFLNLNIKKIAILGDMLELGNNNMHYMHEYIANIAIESNIDFIFLIGHWFNKINIYSKKIKKFENKKKLLVYLKNNISRGILLIKGSRKMSLENIVNYL